MYIYIYIAAENRIVPSNLLKYAVRIHSLTVESTWFMWFVCIDKSVQDSTNNVSIDD